MKRGAAGLLASGPSGGRLLRLCGDGGIAGPQADALRAQIEAARLEGQRRSIAAEAGRAEVMLNASLGRPVRAPVPPLEAPAQGEAPPAPEQVVAAALDARPELRAGTAEIDRAQAEVAVMQSMYSPMAMVRTGPSYTMTDGPGWMVMVGVSIPLWRDKLRAGVAEAQAMAEMARSDLAAMRRMVEGIALGSMFLAGVVAVVHGMRALARVQRKLRVLVHGRGGMENKSP